MKLLLLLLGECGPVNDVDIVLGELFDDLASKELCVATLQLPRAVCNLLQNLLRA